MGGENLTSASHSHLQGVQQNCLHLVSSIFLEQIISNLNKSGEFWKLEEIFYMIGTKIFTIEAHIELSGRRNFRLRCKIRRLSMKILK